MVQVFVEAVIDGGVSCSPQDGGKTYCCASVIDKNGFGPTTYCTTCDDTNPPSNCTTREKPKVVENPGEIFRIFCRAVFQKEFWNRQKVT